MSLHTPWKKSKVNHGSSIHNQLLIAPEVERGIPLCVAVCTTQARCTSFILDEPTLERSEMEELPQPADCLAPTLHQASKSLLGWINRKLHALSWMSARKSQKDQGQKVPSGRLWVWKNSMSVVMAEGLILTHWCSSLTLDLEKITTYPSFESELQV